MKVIRFISIMLLVSFGLVLTAQASTEEMKSDVLDCRRRFASQLFLTETERNEGLQACVDEAVQHHRDSALLEREMKRLAAQEAMENTTIEIADRGPASLGSIDELKLVLKKRGVRASKTASSRMPASFGN